MRPHNNGHKTDFANCNPAKNSAATTLADRNSSVGPSMDPGYTPDDGMPNRLRKEMRRLLQLESLVHAQVEKVIDVVVAEGQAAEKVGLRQGVQRKAGGRQQ